jgi:hypothetical protein
MPLEELLSGVLDLRNSLTQNAPHSPMSNPPTMFASPSGGEPKSPLNDYIQPNLGHALRTWWAFYWPMFLITIVLNYSIGITIRYLYENIGFPARPLILFSRYNSYVVNYVVAIFIMHYILGKRFRHFRLGLQTNSEVDPARELPVTFVRTLRAWWTYTWRTILLFVLGWAFVIDPATWFVGIFRPSPISSVLIFAVLGFVVGGGIALFVIHSSILDEDIGDFRVVLLPRKKGSQLPASLASDPAPLG